MSDLEPIKDDAVTLTAGNSPLLLHEVSAVSGTRVLSGSIKSNQAATFRLSQGKRGENWLAPEDFALTADQGDTYEFVITDSSYKLELVHMGSDASVEYTLNQRAGVQ